MKKLHRKHVSSETPLDNYEHKLKNFLDTGVFMNDPQFEEKKSWLVEAAQNNIPYQTLISLLINNYTEGKTRMSL